jgi:hypothetical protein
MGHTAYEFKVGEWAVAALFSDTRGLDPNQELALERFYEEVIPLIEDAHSFHWSLARDEWPHFGKCDITNRKTMCVDMLLNVSNKKS